MPPTRKSNVRGRNPARAARRRTPGPAVRERIEPSSPTRVGVALVRRPWGTDGAIAVSQFSDDGSRFEEGVTVFIEGGRKARVLESRRSGSATVLRLDAVRSAREAEELRGTIIEMESADLPGPPDGSYYHYEIVGARVRNVDGEELGEVLEIIATGANDVYVVGGRGAGGSRDELLVPAIADVVLDVDVNNRVVTVDLPDGLR